MPESICNLGMLSSCLVRRVEHLRYHMNSELVSLIVLSHKACMLSCCKRNSHDSETLHASFLYCTIPQPLSLLKRLLGSQSCFLSGALGMLWLHFHCCRSKSQLGSRLFVGATSTSKGLSSTLIPDDPYLGVRCSGNVASSGQLMRTSI